MRKTRYLSYILLLLLSLFALVEKSFQREALLLSSPPKNLYLLETVFRHIRNDYIHEVDPNRIIEGSFRGLVNSLDSLSAYLDKQSTSRYLAQKEIPPAVPAETGLILFKKYGGFPAVVGIVDSSPAEKVGLRLGDTITEINRQSTTAMSLVEVNLLLRGKQEETVELKILREEKSLEIKVAKAHLRAEPASYEENEMGVILKIVRLAPPLLTIFNTKILPRLSFTDKPLIIDLRTCQEGTFEEARQFINLFLKKEAIGYLEKLRGKKEPLLCPEDPVLPNTPLLIWVSQATLGPAEAVAAILRESGRAKVIGIPTLGLAAKNEFFPLPDGTSILLATGLFSLPSGDKLWGRGVEPDVRMEVEDLSSSAFLKKSKNLLSAP